MLLPTISLTFQLDHIFSRKRERERFDSIRFNISLPHASISIKLVSTNLYLSIDQMSSIYVLEPPTKGKVLLKTTYGPIDIELWPKEAPKSVRNFVQLCLEGFYDNTIFHRIIKSFLVQAGDPTGTGTGKQNLSFPLLVFCCVGVSHFDSLWVDCLFLQSCWVLGGLILYVFEASYSLTISP